MSMSIVTHVREKSNARSSARTLLFNLAIYANDCCGVAWPSDATLHHDNPRHNFRYICGGTHNISAETIANVLHAQLSRG
jgi:hypothetical protein